MHERAMNASELASRNPIAAWAMKAGFGTVYEAENAGCTERNAHLYRNAKRLSEAELAAAKIDARIEKRRTPERSAPEAPRVLTAPGFLSEFKPIEAVIDGLPVPRGGLVSITGPTGGGKTTLCAALEVAMASGLKFAGRETTSGGVLVLAGENPDDYAMHLKATLQSEGLAVGEVDQLLVVPGVFDFARELDRIHAVVQASGIELVAVFVDTSAAYYLGDDENDNVSMRRHAASARDLCSLPGRPTTFVLCHPTKNAGRDNLLPRGGGAFLAEVDANLTVWKDEAGIVTLHYAGKIRGSSFDPIRFELVPVTLDGVQDCRGRPIASVAVRHIGDEQAEQLQAKELDDENRLLIGMRKKPEGSIADLAKACGFTSGAGMPQKSRVLRMLRALAENRLVEQARGGAWRLTSKGRSEADRLP